MNTDDVDEISRAIKKVAYAITPPDTAPGHDETGGTITSLTEAVMGMTAGLCQIASAINRLADAVEERP